MGTIQGDDLYAALWREQSAGGTLINKAPLLCYHKPSLSILKLTDLFLGTCLPCEALAEWGYLVLIDGPMV